jgi:hypothetical protein
MKLYSFAAVGLLALAQVSGCQVTTPAIKDYCLTYERTVLNRADLAEIRKLPADIRKRIQGNDLDYLCTCKMWKDRACRIR